MAMTNPPLSAAAYLEASVRTTDKFCAIGDEPVSSANPKVRPEVVELRKNVHRFLHEKVFTSSIDGTVVEIGPMQREWTPVPEFFVDTRAHFVQRGQAYLACDIDSGTGAELICDVLDIHRYVAPLSIGAIVATEVIEHVSRVWELPAKFASILKPGGLLFVTVPFHFYRHAPFPDYWRISEDGLRVLFDQHFDIAIESLASGDERKPIQYTLVGRKKANQIDQGFLA